MSLDVDVKVAISFLPKIHETLQVPNQVPSDLQSQLFRQHRHGLHSDLVNDVGGRGPAELELAKKSGTTSMTFFLMSLS